MPKFCILLVSAFILIAILPEIVYGRRHHKFRNSESSSESQEHRNNHNKGIAYGEEHTIKNSKSSSKSPERRNSPDGVRPQGRGILTAIGGMIGGAIRGAISGGAEGLQGGLEASYGGHSRFGGWG